MKNNKLKLILFSLQVFVLVIFIASCKDFFQPPNAWKNPETQVRAALDNFVIEKLQ